MWSTSAEIDCYEQIRELSSAMAAVARAGDWDRLAELESQVGVLRETLIANADSVPDAVAGTREAGRKLEEGRKRELIEQILADDAEIRRHVVPWMANAREFLDSQNHRRMLQHAYAVTDQDVQGGQGGQGGLRA